MVLKGPGVIELEHAPDPCPERDEIVLAVSACGVCRTDLQITSGDLEARTLPIVPGHQIVGRVVAIGSGVTGWSLGDRAGAGWLAWTCGVCTYCTRGRENLCPRALFTGWDNDGGFATHARVRADFAFRLPSGFDDLEAAPLLCGGVIGYRSLLRSGIRPGERLGLYGFGASALITMQVARHWGCRVFVATRSLHEQARARAMGAEWTGHYEQAPPEPLDAAITFAPSGDVVVSALRHTARGGTVAINAIHLDRVPTFSYDMLWLERSLVSVANYTRSDAATLLDLARAIPIRTHFETHPLARAAGALERLRKGQVDGSAVIVM